MKTLRPVGFVGAFLFINIMKLFNIKSPSKKTIRVWAESIYHACELAVQNEFYKYSNTEYLKLNK